MRHGGDKLTRSRKTPLLHSTFTHISILLITVSKRCEGVCSPGIYRYFNLSFYLSLLLIRRLSLNVSQTPAQQPCGHLPITSNKEYRLTDGRETDPQLTKAIFHFIHKMPVTRIDLRWPVDGGGYVEMWRRRCSVGMWSGGGKSLRHAVHLVDESE